MPICTFNTHPIVGWYNSWTLPLSGWRWDLGITNVMFDSPWGIKLQLILLLKTSLVSCQSSPWLTRYPSQKLLKYYKESVRVDDLWVIADSDELSWSLRAVIIESNLLSLFRGGVSHSVWLCARWTAFVHVEEALVDTVLCTCFTCTCLGFMYAGLETN